MIPLARQCMESVAERYTSMGVPMSVDDIRGPARSRRLSKARTEAAALMWRTDLLDDTEIGAALNRERSMVSYYLRCVRGRETA